MHWIDRAAKKLLKKRDNHVIASGISISGHIHIGHSNDVFIADAVRRALERQGEKAEVIWFSDDFDPMRRVPSSLPSHFERYLGMPYADVPSPDEDHESFVDFFVEPFVNSLDSFGVRAKIYSSAEVYRSGELSDQIRTALENSDKIRKILNEYRSKKLPEDWLPFNALCEECGRLATTRAYDWEGDYVSYVCEGTSYVEGCSHEGKANYTLGQGKLTWRVEWPARWEMLSVTCEPFGKDHAAAGGSYDTGKLIAEQVFDYEAPEPIPYEWINLRGKPMSSSQGRVFTLQQWLEVAEPELLRFFIFRHKALKAKDFDPGLPILELYQDYDRLEDLYFGEYDESQDEQLRRVYELSQVDEVLKVQPQRIPIRLAAIMCQVARDADQVIDILVSKGVLQDPSELDIKLAKRRLKCVSNWVEKYAPEQARLEILKDLPPEVKRDLSSKQKECLVSLAESLSKREYGPVEIHDLTYETARDHGLEAVELFEAIYLVLLGRRSGPRVGNFITALDTKFVVKRFKEAAS